MTSDHHLYTQTNSRSQRDPNEMSLDRKKQSQQLHEPDKL